MPQFSWFFWGILFCAVLAIAYAQHTEHDGGDSAMRDHTMMMADDFSNHPCRRKCRFGQKPKVCEYHMELSKHTTMSRDCLNCPRNLTNCERPGCILGSGIEKPVLVANLALPGPSIEVCLGDRIRVTVDNMMSNGESASIHWHGLHQRKTPYMDGAEMVTQCAFVPGTKFTYDFEAHIDGTYFWHSHVNMQRGDGIAGPLIIRHPKDPHRHLYDRDDLQPIMTQDWFPNETWSDHFALLSFGSAGFTPPQVLLNGRWAIKNGTSSVPPYEYHLNPELRYRFRIINNAAGDTPMKFEFTGHSLVVIATDGQSIKPVVAKSITVMPAERFDVIPYFTGEKASKRGVYKIRVRGLGFSAKIETARSYAKIVYDGGENPKPSSVKQASGGATSVVLEEVNYWHFADYPTGDPKIAKKASQLRSIFNTKANIYGKPDIKIFAELVVGHPSPTLRSRVVGRINKIISSMAPAPLLSQWDDIPKEMFCNSEHRYCNGDQFCECIHVEPIPLGSLVEMVLFDTGTGDSVLHHSMHLHGYQFNVIAMDTFDSPNVTASDVAKMEKMGLLKRNLNFAPLKDVVGVPMGGYVIIRFLADNAGAWLFHCHIDVHMQTGMMMTFLVGEPDDVPPVPPHFPHCLHWEAPQYRLVRKLPKPSLYYSQKMKQSESSY